MGTTQLKYTPNSTSTRYKATISAWVKRTNIGAEGWIFEGKNGTSQADGFRFQANNTINMLLNDGGGGSCTTNRLFRDNNAFYHLMWVVDTTQATASDRMKLYVNGVQETSFSSASYPAQNFAIEGTFVNGQDMYIGTQHGYNYFEGVMSHYHICDGYAYQPSDFGSTDAVTGEWKINTSPSVSYGTHGAFILKDGNSVTDQSGNSNNWSVHGGTLTNTEDCPSNVFATLNPLVNYSNFSGGTLSNGNTTHSNSSGTSNKISTLGMTSGKFYAEAKYTGGGNYNGVGFCSEPFLSGAASLANSTHGASLTYTDVYNGGVAYGTYATPSTNDIIGIALDIDNGYAYFSNNGVWGNSGVPTSGSTGTGGFLISKTDANSTYFFASEQNATPGTRGADWNFGNGFFGTTAISSEGTNASGIGKFEYDVPTGFTALSTKGLNE